jgi:hypothetical protein
METEDSDPEHSPAQEISSTEVCETLVKFLADSLRDLPEQQRTFLYLPRVLVGTEWSRWVQDLEPMQQAEGLQFRFWYTFHPHGAWNAKDMCTRLSELWRIWGWNCSIDDERPASGYHLTGSSPEGYELTFRARAERQQSCIEIVSPLFTASGSEPVSMPFAVTPFGPMTLATVWALHPELIVW